MLTNQTHRDQRMSHLTVAIIGGGFTGTTLVAQLLRKSGASVSVFLIERGARLGRGVAYGTECMEHLLNVPARNMSAYPNDPEHFLEWARRNHDCGASADDYLPRPVFGQYVASVLQQEIERHRGQVQHVQDEAVSIAHTGETAEIRLRSGRTLLADKVVIALGNFPPGDPRLPGRTPHSLRYVSNPWKASALGDVARDKSVLLVGSGLTSVDVTISLRQHGFRGTIHILSRRGLLPQTHKAAAVWPPFWDGQSPRTVRGLLRLIRTQVEAAEKAGSGWRAVIDSLRPFTQEIWRSLSLTERRRFLRHVRPYWDVHRHRVAPAIGVRLASQMQDGQIKIHAGHIKEYVEDIDGIDVTYRDRESGQLERMRADRVINCTGPESDCRKVDDPLLTNLMRQKLARPDSLFLGLDVSPDGALIDVYGAPSNLLYAIGPVRKGSLWETIAVPELRVQVSELSRLLQIESREEFIHQLTTNLPPRPEYFPQDAQLNRSGTPALPELPGLKAVSTQELQFLLNENVIALDVRSPNEFASRHVPGSINIPLSGQFALWAGTLLGVTSRPVLIATSSEQLSEARTRLARVGVDDTRGYLQDGIEGWVRADLELAALPQMTVQQLSEHFAVDKFQLLDVRRKSEWEAGHIETAAWWPLERFKTSLPRVDRNAPIAVLCKGGYRSMIACSWLRREGFRNVTNVIGGFDAWESSRLPFVTELFVA
jgi:uncharacterized NAD(P)/FAD-binding protein YdhS/rhodanese-related sulfurtransferase